MKRTLKLGCAFVAIAAACLIAYALYAVDQVNTVLVPEAMAAGKASNLIIRYMHENDGAWPRGWDDLIAIAEESGLDGTERRWVVEELPKRVAVDWAADPRVLARVSCDGEHPPFHVVTRANGKPLRYWSEEPNTLIWEYLQDPEEVGERGRDVPPPSDDP